MRIGIDLGGTKIEGIALDEGREVARRRIDTPRDDYAATVDAIAAIVADLERAAGARGTVGVGIPGDILAPTGLVKNANSTWLLGRPLKTTSRTRWAARCASPTTPTASRCRKLLTARRRRRCGLRCDLGTGTGAGITGAGAS